MTKDCLMRKSVKITEATCDHCGHSVVEDVEHICSWYVESSSAFVDSLYKARLKDE